jgi:hypothetical protein
MINFPVATFPGILSVERHGLDTLRYARVHPASGWMGEQNIVEWKHQVYMVSKASLSQQVKEKLGILLPEEQVSPTYVHALTALRATHLVQISHQLGCDLANNGVRVWTVGYHRGPSIIRIVADRGFEPRLHVEQVIFDFFSSAGDRPIGRPAGVKWYGRYHDQHCIDWILRAVSRDVIDEPSILLACAIARDWRLLLDSEDSRRSTYDETIDIRNDPNAAAFYYAGLQYDDTHASAWETWAASNGAQPAQDTISVAQAMAASDGPTRVQLVDYGVFWREELPALPLAIEPIGSHGDGYFEPLIQSRSATRAPPNLLLPTLHRYVGESR